MKIRQTAVDEAAQAIAERRGRSTVTGADYDLATVALFALAPVVLEAERERLRTLIDPRKLELLALHFAGESLRPSWNGDPVQDIVTELRQWAFILRGGTLGPQSASDVLIDAVLATGGLSGDVIADMKAAR